MTKPIRMKVRLYNNRLVRMREEMGLSQRVAAERIGVSQGFLCALEGLRPDTSPVTLGGEWSASARRIADYYGVEPAWLWPGELKLIRCNGLMLELSEGDASVLGGGARQLRELSAKETATAVTQALAKLAPIERRILEARFGLHDDTERTLRDVGEPFGLSGERIRILEMQALEHLRMHMAMGDGVSEDEASVLKALPRYATPSSVYAAMAQARRGRA